jgi:hypothetical protein
MSRGRSRKVGVKPWLVAAALCLAVIGCSATTPTPAAPTPAPTPAQATDTQGHYQLVFELPRTDWRTSDAITGEATLSLIGADAVDFSSSGSGPIVFSFDEIGGSWHVTGLGTPSCQTGRFKAGQPFSSPIKKSGHVISADPQPSDFDRLFMMDPVVHLPAGDWTITAIASILDGSDCRGTSYTLKAAILVHVTA